MTTVRIVKPEEKSRLQEIGELTALAYLADGLVDHAHPYVPQLRDAEARARHAHLLAMLEGDGEGAIVGTVTLVPPGSPFVELASEGEYELRMLAVSPLERGRGLGRELTQAAMDLATQMGAKRIVLSTMSTMHAAHRLYEHMGFKRHGEQDFVVRDNPDGTITRLPAGEAERTEGSIELLAYSWEPGH